MTSIEVVFNTLRAHKELTRPQLMALTKLNKDTISWALSSLLKRGDLKPGSRKDDRKYELLPTATTYIAKKAPAKPKKESAYVKDQPFLLGECWKSVHE